MSETEQITPVKPEDLEINQTWDREPVPFRVNLLEMLVYDRVRKTKANEELPELAASMRRFGQLQPIVVRNLTEEEKEKFPNKKHALVAGGRRTAAAALNNWTTLLAIDYGELSPWRQLAIELEENLQRRSMEMADELEAKLRLHELYAQEHPGWQMKDTAVVLGESAPTISRDLSLAKAMREDPSLKKATSKKAAARQLDVRTQMRAKAARLTTMDQNSVRSKLVNMDARDFARSLKTHTVDLVFTDLPYGIDYHSLPSDQRVAGGGQSSYDDSAEAARDLMTDLVPHMIRVTKPTGWLALFMNRENYGYLEELIGNCCATHFEYRDEKAPNRRCKIANAQARYAYKMQYDHEANEVLPVVINDGDWKNVDKCRWLAPEPLPWIWYRPNSRSQGLYPERHAKNEYETILICNMGEARLIGGPHSNVLPFEADYNERIHTMQKPLPLCEEIVRRLTLTGEMVVDFTFGSGVALRAAARLGRSFRGSEKNKDLVDLAISFVGQDYGGEIITVDPNATAKDYKGKAVMRCSDCGATWSGNNPTCTLCETNTGEAITEAEWAGEDTRTLEEQLADDGYEETEGDEVPF